MCRVGFTGGSVLSGLGALVTTARTVIPDAELDLREMVSRAQVEALTDDGSLDIGLVRPPVTRPDLVSRPLIREPLVAALPKNHPLAGLDRPVDITDLHGIDLVMYSPIDSHYFFELLSSVFHEASVAPVVVQHLTQIHTILSLVHFAWGVAVVPESASKMHFDNVVCRVLIGVSAAPAGFTSPGSVFVSRLRRLPSPGGQARPRVTLCANRLRGCLGFRCCGCSFVIRTADAVPRC